MENSMTRRDAVCVALHHKETFPIPYHIDFTAQALQQMIAATGNADIEEKTGSYLHYIQYWGWPTEMREKSGHFKDEFGVVWNRGGVDKDIGIVDHPQIDDIEESAYKFSVLDTARLRRDIENLIATKKDRFTMMGFGFCMYERAWSLMGMQNALMSMVASSAAMEKLFTQIGDYFINLVDIALEYDVDAIYFGDDWGQQRGLIMGINHWRHYIKPQMARLYARVKSKGKFVVQHSCGDCHELFPDLIDIGMDCYQTFQPEIYDIAEMKKLYGNHISFWGGVSTQRALPRLSSDELKKEIVRVMHILRKSGGLIIAPTHALPFDVPAENILAMIDVFQHQERYL
jgi:uroporphyrinogen decarboxylase